MKAVFLAISFVCWFSYAYANSSERSRPVSIVEVQKLVAPVTIKQLERRFGTATGQAGPRLTYPCAGRPGMLLWFWYRDRVIQFVALDTPGEDRTIQGTGPRIIWPPELIKVPFNKLNKGY